MTGALEGRVTNLFMEYLAECCDPSQGTTPVSGVREIPSGAGVPRRLSLMQDLRSQCVKLTYFWLYIAILFKPKAPNARTAWRHPSSPLAVSLHQSIRRHP